MARSKAWTIFRASRGIGPKRIEKMRKYVTVGMPAGAGKTGGNSKKLRKRN
jgi:hypothetical protein